MPYLLDISTAVPDFSISNQQVLNFYSKFLEQKNAIGIRQKLSLIIKNSQISNRFSCIPDFDGASPELFSEENYNPSIEKRIEVYKENSVPLSIKAIDKLLNQTKVSTNEITHIITVSCTGLLAPGLEFLLADHYNIRDAEKLAINFLGCYAAIKALKHANYIAQADPDACILIVCTELCSLHFNSSNNMEDVIANLLFADGAAALMVCGNNSSLINNKLVFHIDSIGSASIPDTLELMTWSITSSAFRMFLSRKIVVAIREHIHSATEQFLGNQRTAIGHWAIHPGGIRIVQAVRDGLHLNDTDIVDSLTILQNFGNMSSPTILFILKRIFDKIKTGSSLLESPVFACAFGPGLNIEMIQFSPVHTTINNYKTFQTHAHATHG